MARASDERFRAFDAAFSLKNRRNRLFTIGRRTSPFPRYSVTYFRRSIYRKCSGACFARTTYYERKANANPQWPQTAFAARRISYDHSLGKAGLKLREYGAPDESPRRSLKKTRPPFRA